MIKKFIDIINMILSQKTQHSVLVMKYNTTRLVLEVGSILEL